MRVVLVVHREFCVVSPLVFGNETLENHEKIVNHVLVINVLGGVINHWKQIYITLERVKYIIYLFHNCPSGQKIEREKELP